MTFGDFMDKYGNRLERVFYWFVLVMLFTFGKTTALPPEPVVPMTVQPGHTMTVSVSPTK